MKNLKLTDEQYKYLIQLVYLGNFMANATRNNDEMIPQFEELEQHVYSFAAEFGCGEFVDRHDAVEGIYPTREFEEMMDKLISEYDADIFWEELLHRMTERDLVDAYGEQAVAGMSIVERIEKERGFIQNYDKEFSENGLKNLYLKK
jgi:N-methylhydantoinase A/oxoprolinase/acetone carboxylase beta subunit